MLGASFEDQFGENKDVDMDVGTSSSFSQKASAASNKMQGLSHWDPIDSPDWDAQEASLLCISRIKRDITTIYSEPPPLIFILPEENDLTRIHAIISGPQNTPYEGGFFYFYIRMSPDYPIVPPRVKLLTNGKGTVRFNPNLYANGKVCLSILGTWSGPPWSAAQSINSLLISIQSLMNDKPYYNEPGFSKERNHGDCKKYSDYIRHETLRVAVCNMLEEEVRMPPQLREMMERTFLESVDLYEEIIGNNIHMDGTKMFDMFRGNHGCFQYAELLQRVSVLAERLREKYHGLGRSDKFKGTEIDI